MKALIYLAGILLFITACNKAVQFPPPAKPASIANTPDAGAYAAGLLPPDQFAQFNWQQQVLININDTFQLIKVLAQQQTNHSFSYLLVHRQRGQYSDVVVHNIEYNIGTRQKIPVAISSHSYARQKLAKQVFNLNTTETKNRLRVEYHLKPLSHDVPYTTLPVVTITARYRNGGTEFVPPTTYALMDGAFAATGGASGGADGSANPYDPYIYLDCLDPMYVPETGSGSMPPTLDPATNSFFEYKKGEWKWFNMSDYPGKEMGFPFRYWETPSTTAEAAAMQALDEEYAPYSESACHGTARWGGNPFWQGTIEHITVQFYYMSIHPLNARREFSIPYANANGTANGYADIVNVSSGEIFEIKSASSSEIANGELEMDRYVTKANQYCSSPFRKGTNFSPVVLPNLKYPAKGLRASLSKNGVITYQTVDDLPQITPLPVPESTAEKLKNFIHRLTENSELAEYQIREFFRQNPELATAIKTTVITAGIAMVVATIVEDIISGGWGVLDDIAHFKMAHKIITYALAL